MNAYLKHFAVGSLIAVSLVVMSCMDSAEVFNPEAQLNKEVAAIDNYLTANNISAVKLSSGVRMVITQLGTGLPAQATSKVEVEYIGKLFSNGTVFAPKATTKEDIKGYIDGWQIALLSLPEGSKATIYIPSYHGYGNQARTSIPANSTLVFDLDFKDAYSPTPVLQRLATDTVAINNYLQTKNVQNVVKDTTGIRYVITQEGSGPTSFFYNKVKIKYSIKLLSDDTKTLATFTSEPIEDYYSLVVDQLRLYGVKIGLLKMREGSKATLYVPSGYGYGSSAYQNSDFSVPANSNLIIDMELIDIVQ